ncbi:hypothetical protein COY45_00770 [Candidatus Berkelbacteria bacterium CG_4_10_14_0_8_um_filter_42_34]|uniref:Nucleotidyl transferase AbiEii/AbiGii toxin family protein n=1 Tax=Candidatus Berkelbacteria bacterium CG_4_10_14_0_8_um_filter_42_34 TaxID=1974502 RepID=A0A2M7SX68_9BACT|nr:MAG: hypothetical protein COY45_00770 [Candidatus Berkelbacteria bacterium CG_4_10_14_0_8_um_filter_42_34]
MFLEVLDKKRQKLLSQLGFLKKYGFYMAGGTALALHLGHRTSLDFDFYTRKKFNNQSFLRELEKRFKTTILIETAEQTLIVRINEVEVSFFHYPYPLAYPFLNIGRVSLASKEDIAAMKIIAVSDRGTKRDFIDIYFLLKEFSIEKMFGFIKKKYPNFNIYVGLRGLTYFADAEEKQKRRLYLFHFVSWTEVKRILIKEVKNYQTKCLKQIPLEKK